MNQSQLVKIIEKLFAEYDFYAPCREQQLLVKKINNSKQIDWSGDIPVNTFKQIVLPTQEKLAEIKKDKYGVVMPQTTKTIIWGINILDLEALTLFDQVFAEDVYYQKRKANQLRVGFSAGIEVDRKKYKVFHAKFKEHKLEHLRFDVFIEKQKNNNLLLFSGSQAGQKFLDKLKIVDYEHIEYVGPVPEEGIDKKILQNKQAVELSENNPLWDKLAEICLACGKCSIVCPTCFCFNQFDEVEFDKIDKKRQWTSCFYPEFSKVAGGYKELDSIKKKLYFWYYHKFVRIPQEFSMTGCVSCMRCYKTCPVKINIAKNLIELNKTNEK